MEKLCYATLKYYQLSCFNFYPSGSPIPTYITLLCTSLPCSIREASLVRTSGKAAHSRANGSQKAALLIAQTLHTDLPNPSVSPIGRRMHKCKPQAFQTPFGVALIIPLSIQYPC